MASYRELFEKADNELSMMKKTGAAAERLITRFSAFESAMKVLARHNLMAEFAEQVSIDLSAVQGEEGQHD